MSGFDHFLEGVDDVVLNAHGHGTGVRKAQTIGDIVHVAEQLLEHHLERNAGTLVLDQAQGVSGIPVDVVLPILQLIAAGAVGVVRAGIGPGLDRLVEVDGGVADLDLHGEHTLATGLQRSQGALVLLATQLVLILQFPLSGTHEILRDEASPCSPAA